MTKKTAGQISSELLKGAFTNTHTPYDQANEQLSDYEKNIHECIVRGVKQFKGDFFVVVLMKKERLMSNVMRLYYLPRQTCPTPQHEQVVYKYHRETGTIEFIWVVPSLEACVTLVNEMDMAHPEERQLLQFVLDFRDGTLLNKAKQFNGEYVNKESHGRTGHSGIIT